MPLSTIARVEFDANVAHTRGDAKRPPAAPKRKTPDPDGSPDPEAASFAIVSEGTASTAGLSILAHALAAYSDS